VRKITAVVALVALSSLAACQKTGEGEYKAITPDVDVKTDTTTIRTPSVDVNTRPETTVVNVPTVDVKTPAERKRP
jgi:hypothetical protein